MSTGNALTHAKTHSQTSDSTNSAFTMSIFETSPRGSPVHVFYGCNVNWAANTVYRTLHESSSTGAHGIESYFPTQYLLMGTVSRMTPTTASSPTTLLHTPTIPSPTSSDTSTSTDAPSAPESSQAWVAGAVIGPVAGCALVGGLVWWITRYRKKRTAATTAESAGKTSSGPYHRNQPLGLWPSASPPPSHGPTRHSPASGGTSISQHDLLNVSGNMNQPGEVYEMHHAYR